MGDLVLAPAFQHIGVVSNFSGDDNGNNQANLEYRQAGTQVWKQGIPMTPDRRETLAEYDTSTDQPDWVPNPFKNQWRAVIFGLAPATQYEIKVTYTDPDGVAGATVTGTVITRNDNPFSEGSTYYVAKNGNDGALGTFEQPWQTLQHAADVVGAGDRVLIMPGTYDRASISKSGVEGNYIAFESYDPDNKAIIDGGAPGLQLLGSYLRIKGITIQNTSGSSIVIGSSETDLTGNIIEDCLISNPSGGWPTAGIFLRGCQNTLIQRNTIEKHDSPLADNFGIFFYGASGGNVVRSNTIRTDGSFKDGIGSGPSNFKAENGIGPNSFVYDNYVYGPWGDGLEIEGGGMNVAVWGNTIKNNQFAGDRSMIMGLAFASVIVGPLYACRNVVIDHSDAWVKLGSSSYGNIYLYHNTVYSTRELGQGFCHFGNDSIAENITARNNIVRLSDGNVIGNWDNTGDKSLNSYDYNNMWTDRQPGGWECVWYNTKYTSHVEFKATGQEVHGISASNNRYVNTNQDDFRLQSDSPNIDKGVFLQGFNDPDSPWSHEGAAPDIGAFEFGANPQPPPVTSYCTLTIMTDGAGSTNPTSGKYQYAEGTAVTISAEPDGGWRLANWTGDTSDTESAVITVIMDSDKILTASFRQVYFLELDTVPPDLTTIMGESWYEYGTRVTTGTAPETVPVDTGTRYAFVTWIIDGIEQAGNPVSMTMDSPHKVKATYRMQYYVKIESEAGDIEVTGWHDYGARVTTETALNIVDDNTGTRYVFSTWTVDGEERTGNPISITINTSHDIEAVYSIQYQLTVESEYGDAGDTLWYNAGSTAQISVPPITGMLVRRVFVRWSGDSADTTPTTTVIMDNPKTMVAEWRTDYIQLYILIAVLAITVGTVAIILVIRKRRA